MALEISVPRRGTLLKLYERSQLFGKGLLLVDLVMVVLAVFYLRFSVVLREPVEAGVVFGASSCPYLFSLVRLLFEKKKRIEDLREDVKFGEISKRDLLSTTESVLQKMQIPKGDVKIFVTGQKEVNAFALATGLGWLLPGLRVVYLNRGTLHALSPEEVGTVIAHELAHIYRYPLAYQKALFFHVISSALFALMLWSNNLHMMIALMFIGFYHFSISWVFGRFHRVVEFLCDDCGAELCGIENALRAEFKVSQHSATISHAYRVALKRRLSGLSISTKEIQQVINDALTFESPQAKELEQEVLKGLERMERRANDSFFYFFKGLLFQQGPREKRELHEHYDELTKISQLATLDLPQPSSAGLNLDWFRELVKQIRANPQQLLFNVPEEILDRESSHPGPRRRILYLWENFLEAGPSG